MSLAAGAEEPAGPSAAGGRARSVIQIWLWGGPSHLDTFDPKPEAGYDYCGPFDKTIQTNIPGIQINELLPRLAKIADKYSIIRSLTHGIDGHETAAYITQTGHKPGEALSYPSVGAVVALFKGYEHGYRGQLPPYIILTTSQGRFSEVGFLGSKYKPLVTGGDPNGKTFAVEGLSAPGISSERQLGRWDLLKKLDTLGRTMPADPYFASFDRSLNEAHELITGDAARVFDLTTEKDEVRDRYGRTRFGQSCLVARRLVESGVPYVTINYGGWDTHKQHFQSMRQKLPELDNGLSALLEDLAGRGLLESTVVWCCGEFGRTPRILWEAPWNGGRGHYGKCFSVLVAGGGFKGGRVVGTSDARGETVKERPVTPQDLIASLYTLLGIDPDGRLPDSQGRNLPLLPPPTPGTSRNLLREIM
ncbi:MAG: hypothetical protein BWY73_00539 [candidate division TA06 bacterium ADurb.Bin417]|uniref:DUF1501 domain-containing protein n=1 Tax=candidate division TA06 bacterium ADurb.Bin417 TaxID=1852828 RepID=A0A1V5MIS3_UNCT6|nr:MAG: hypothetical protein BWY73_00539 [candidate division TA06 bacterium ADurb.Bin417]